MIISRRLFSLFLLMFFYSNNAFAQDSIAIETVRMPQITVDDGLSQGFVYDGLQDNDGFLWFATMDGLNRYDGYNFIVYKHDPENPYSLPENSINCIAKDDKDNLWIGTRTKGLYIMDKRTDRFYPVPISSSLNKDNNFSITKITSLQNRLYIKTNAGMMICRTGKLANDDVSVQEQQVHVMQLFPLTNEDEYQLRVTGRHSFLINSFGSLEIFAEEKKDTNWTRKTLTANDLGIKSFDWTSHFFLMDSVNNLLIFHQGHIYLYNLLKKQINLLASYGNHRINGLTLIKNKIYTCAYEDGVGNTLYEFDLIDHSLKKYHPGNDVRLLQVMFKDRTGVLWIRTDAAGICLFNSKLQAFKAAPYMGRNVLGTKKMIVNPYEKELSRGIFEFFPKDRRFKKLLSSKVSEQEKDYSLFDFIDHRNRFWKANHNGTHKNILIEYDTVNKQVSKHDLGFKYILLLFEDHENRLWCVHRGGDEMLNIYLTRLDKQNSAVDQTWISPVKMINTDGRFIMGHWQDQQQVFWFATDVGLISFDPSQTDQTKIWKHWKNIPADNSSLSADKLISLCPDPREPQKYLWLGTRGSGFNRFEIATGKCMRYSEKDGLANNVAYDIVPDDLGNLWISTNMGLSCFTPPGPTFPKGKFRNFTEEDGIAGNEFNGLTGKKLLTGELFFHGVKGTTWFKPGDVLQQQDAVPINFISLSVNNKILQWEKDSSVINGNIAYSKQISLRHDQNIFSISFSSMDFRNKKGKLYSYYLEGFDKDWTEPSPQHSVTYTNLNPGSYTFYVRGSNTDGKWNEKGNSIHIVIVPAWYQTWFFKIATILFAVGSVYLLYRWRLAQQTKLLRVRNSIARDLHDEIGSTLSSISLSSAIIQKKMDDNTGGTEGLLKQISSNTDAMMEAMSDIVWAINTKNDRFENVVNRMRAFAIEILEPKGCVIHFANNKNLDGLKLDMAQRKNLYLLFKEAINNAAKYAASSNVWIDISMNEHRMLVLKIKDDGNGFSLATVENGNTGMAGNGLPNMRKRAQELNGTLNIHAGKGIGTQIILEFRI
ncbi:MAG: two-component regulator propeller domain-containing protein [Ferruginibacter sp.]